MDEKGTQGTTRTSPTRLSLPAAHSSPGLLPQGRRGDGSSPLLPPDASSVSVAGSHGLESWIEVSSQPSSSSLSSIGDEIVTTGLRVGGPGGRRRRRRLPASARSLPQQQTAIHTASSSSQEEYDESESDEDRLLTSSAENLRASHEEALDDSDADSDDADNATALGRVSDRPVFHPQPNAFSHPSHLTQRSNSSNAAIPAHPHGDFRRPSFSRRSQTRVHRGGPSFMSAAAQEDNDAALRASLTTLLSCAAAARRLPKSKEEAEARRAGSDGVGPSDRPVELRLIPESELMEGPGQPQSPPAPLASRKRSSPAKSPTRDGPSDKSERAVSGSRNPRATKKKKTAAPVADETTLISPTLLTWVVSAGVVVLVSVVGFGAGYVIGREVGRQEILSASVSGVNETSSCGREAIRTSSSGLRRLRWGVVGRSIVAQA